jgi:hypothetical protein
VAISDLREYLTVLINTIDKNGIDEVEVEEKVQRHISFHGNQGEIVIEEQAYKNLIRYYEDIARLRGVDVNVPKTKVSSSSEALLHKTDENIL